MLLSISTTHQPATDLGYILHKNPAKVQTYDLAVGKATVVYAYSTPELCTAVMLLEVDAVGLIRGRGEQGLADQYVNDRPYAASSFLSVAIAQVLGSALNGRCRDKPELANLQIPLQLKVSAVPCRAGETFLRALFEPLGYEVRVEQQPLDEQLFPAIQSGYFTLTLSAICRVQDALSHLYVLIPVLDDKKHYWVAEEEVEKLLRHGEGWLANHPEKESITRKYLRHRGNLTRQALARLIPEEAEDQEETTEEVIETPIRLHDVRLETVAAKLSETNAKTILDLGCGEGKLLKLLLQHPGFTKIVGMDVSMKSLEIAQDRLNFDRMSSTQRQRIELIHGSLLYRDTRLHGFDAAACVEVIEHLDPPRLAAFERVMFQFARPKIVIITTPNREYNVNFPTLAQGKFRHGDHRFEWTRKEFQDWSNSIASRFGYSTSFEDLGPQDPVTGSPTQMGIFSIIQA
jgi:3' terminal RNA ribose 2'-O-methyltransferase Hen1